MDLVPGEDKSYCVGDTIKIDDQTTLVIVAIREGEVVLGIDSPPGIVPIRDPDTGERFDVGQ